MYDFDLREDLERARDHYKMMSLACDKAHAYDRLEALISLVQLKSGKSSLGGKTFKIEFKDLFSFDYKKHLEAAEITEIEKDET